MLIPITTKTPTIKQIWLYTWKACPSRFENSDRDVLKKIEIVNKKVYRKEKRKQAATTLPDEKLEIRSFSYPQYYPYNKLKGKTASKQRKIKHQYDSIFVLQKNPITKLYDWDSKIKWRIGSYKKWNAKPSQTKIKSIYRETRMKLIKKLESKYKLNKKKMQEEYKKEVNLIKQRGIYLNIGDYNSQELGLNGDFYFRSMPLLIQYDCLFGPLTNVKFNTKDKDLKFPFFGKHEIRVILELIRKKIFKIDINQ